MIKYISLIIVTIITFSCAQFIAPTGGPRDIKPPTLLSALPKDKTLNFNSKTITLEFDEYLDITSLKQELIIVPELKSFYDAKMKNKTVVITIPEKLDSNTTYTFNFRNGIKDLTEKNPAKNLKYVISTGSKIDSLFIRGNIIDINTKKPILDMLVGIYTRNDTLSPLKRKPTYFTKTDSAGNYLLENIKNNNYTLLAFKDKNFNLTYEPKNEIFGFLKDTIRLTQNITLDTLETYFVDNTHNKIKRTSSRENTFTIQTDKSIKETKFVDINSNNIITLDYNTLNTDIIIFKTEAFKQDTLDTKILLTDSLNVIDTLIQKIYFSDPFKTTKKKILEPMSIRMGDLTNNKETNNKLRYEFNFSYPIIRFDTANIIFKTDTLEQEKPKFIWPSKTKLLVEIETIAKQTTQLIIPGNTFENFKGDTNSFISVSNIILQKNDLGYLSGNTIENTSTKIAQLLNADLKVLEEHKFIDKFEFKDVLPGIYRIKIIFDKNDNGIWDPGNYETKTYPEKILINKEEIKIKANFEIRDYKVK